MDRSCVGWLCCNCAAVVLHTSMWSLHSLAFGGVLQLSVACVVPQYCECHDLCITACITPCSGALYKGSVIDIPFLRLLCSPAHCVLASYKVPSAACHTSCRCSCKSCCDWLHAPRGLQWSSLDSQFACCRLHVTYAQNASPLTVLQLVELEVSNMYFIEGTLPSSWSSLTQVSTYTIVYVLALTPARGYIALN